MILFVMALLPLLATVTSKPAGSRGDPEIICDVILPYGFNDDFELQHGCRKNERFKVSFSRLATQEKKAAIQLFFEPTEEADCVGKLGLGESELFCDWQDIETSTSESCKNRPDYTAYWQDSGTTGENGIWIRIYRSMELKNESGCE